LGKKINISEYKTELLSSLGVLITFKLFSMVLVWNETRSGFHIRDVVLENVGPYENHLIIFLLTYGLAILGLWNSLSSREGWIRTMFSIMTFLFLRTITLSMLPLNPPTTIIPLKDFFLTNTFYCSKILVRDLFFSGHTCSVFMLFFLVESKIVKYILCMGGVILASLLILQHVHYSIDVVAAPFFAYIAYRSGIFFQQKFKSKLEPSSGDYAFASQKVN
jgi:hypothetical protein